MERFGEFLVQRGVISTAELMDALALGARLSRNLSLMALGEKFLGEEDLERIAAHGVETGDDFEESLLELGLISEERLAELQEAGKEHRIPLGELLLRNEVLTERELKHWLEIHEGRTDDPAGLLQLLRRIEAFQPLAGGALEKLASLGKLRTREPGELVYREGDAADAVYLVEAGLVRLSSGEGEDLVELGIVRSQEHFGLSAVLGGDARLETARVVTRSAVWSVRGGDVRRVLGEDPAGAAEIAARAARNLNRISRGIKDRIGAFESNIYSLILETGLISRDLVIEFVRALARETTRTVQVIYSESDLNLPDAIELPRHLDPGDGERVHLLGIPELHPERDLERILKWVHGESRHASALVFLISLPGIESPGRRDAERTAELLLENSRRSLILTRGDLHDYLEKARKGRDRIQLVHDARADMDFRFARMKKAHGDCLAPITFKPDQPESSLRKAARRLLGREIGIVLGGGGAKCAAHLGVLQVLEEAGIPLDVVAASSSGNMIASTWAAGIPLNELRESYLDTFARRKVRFPDWTLPFRGHLANGKPGRNYLRRMMGDARTFDSLHAYLPVAVDMNRGKDVMVGGCETWRAAFASSAIPGFLPLVEHEGALLADGALANNVPSSHAREYGAAFVISVNISPTPSMTSFDPRSIAANMLRSAEVMMHQTTSRHVEFTDLEIRPDIGTYGMFDFSLSERFIDLGREAARAKLPELRYMLGDLLNHRRDENQ